jgi:hypothetical protein
LTLEKEAGKSYLILVRLSFLIMRKLNSSKENLEDMCLKATSCSSTAGMGVKLREFAKSSAPAVLT